MSSRLVHLWSGVLLAVPMFIVGVTAVFIAHKDALGLKDMPVGFMPAGMEREHELRSVAQDASGQLWLGGQQGLVHLGADGQLDILLVEAGQLGAKRERLLAVFEADLAGLAGEMRGSTTGRGHDRVEQHVHRPEVIGGVEAVHQHDRLLLAYRCSAPAAAPEYRGGRSRRWWVA